jgi:hypothetical protein
MRDETTNEIIGCFPDAFGLREGERNLSVSWLEYFGQNRLENLRQD